jgi:hypothetical protein
MGVKKDAGELLIYFYQELVNNKRQNITPENVLNETKWDANKINHAFRYLKDLGLLKEMGGFGNFNRVDNFIVLGLSPEGINIIENKPKFKRSFSFEIGIPDVFKFSWGASED